MNNLIKTALIVLLTAFSSVASAQIAPEFFRNKTYQFGFVETEKARLDETGESGTFVISRHFTLFISSAGRSFGRQEVSARNLDFNIVRSGRGGGSRPGISGVAERGPGASSSNLRGLGDQYTVRKREFAGNKIRIFTQFSGVSRLVEIDVSGSGCSIDVKYGREGGGAKKRHTLAGKPYTILSQSISGERCRLQEGNHI